MNVRNDWSREEIQALYNQPFLDLIFEAQRIHREHFDPNTIQVSTLLSIKTGKCPEDCKYCSQSARYDSKLEAEKRIAVDKVIQEAKEALAQDLDNNLIQMALIQTFEFTYELGWKVIKDFLKYNGIDVKLPREVIKEGFAAAIITDGQAWIEMMDDRNATSHTYNEEFAAQIIKNILNNYSNAFAELEVFLSSKLDG